MSFLKRPLPMVVVIAFVCAFVAVPLASGQPSSGRSDTATTAATHMARGQHARTRSTTTQHLIWHGGPNATLQQKRAFQIRVIKHDRQVIAFFHHHRFTQNAANANAHVAVRELHFALAQLAWTTRELAQTNAAIAARQTVATHADDVWDKLVGCEATGDWSINSGNRFYGGLQFTYSTWTTNGGPDFDISQPFPFSRALQITIAKRVLAAQGWNAWPSCSRQLGLH